MPAYIGPTSVIVTEGQVPSDTPAPNVTSGSIAWFSSGPYEYQIQTVIAFFGGDYAPAPDPDPCPDPIPGIPTAADPPFPPVWPYPWGSDVLYGRDNVGVILKMVRMDTLAINFVAIKESDGNALDLTGGSLTMTARFQVNSVASVFELTTSGGGIVVTDATAGEFTVTIPSAATEDVPLIRTVLFYDVQWKSGSTRYTVNRGQLIILPDITTS